MATIPYVKPQTVAESSAQNALIQQVNTNTNGLESASSALSTTNGTVSDLQSRIAALESEPSGGIPAGTYFGQWTDDNGGSGQLIDTPDNGEKVTLFTTPVGIPTGMTMNTGTVTIANAGLYLITASVQTITNNGTLIAMWLGQSSATSGAGAKLGPNSGFRCDVLSATALVRLPANSPISVYASNWQGTPPIGLWRSRGNVLTVSYLGP